MVLIEIFNRQVVSPQNLTKVTRMKRLQIEMMDTMKSYDLELVDENMYEWQIAINGPNDTPYYGGTFLLRVKFPDNYPDQSPVVSFETKIYHPNVSRHGNVCLGREWNARISVKSIIDGIVQLMLEPDANNPLEPTLAKQYISRYDEFRAKAVEITIKYAI